MNLVIFHHHLSRGGVGSVIRMGIRALRLHSGPARIRVVLGEVEGNIGLDAENVEVHRLPEIGYVENGERGRQWNERAEALASKLLDRFGSYSPIWWIHNYHLGKNPLFTQAVLRIASSPTAPRMILQPHDFPEAGRFSNLSDIDRWVSLPLYPVGHRIRYALLTQRDFDILKRAGIPAGSLFLLENPVSPPPARDARGGEEDRLFPPDHPSVRTFLFPVRAIRRKNILEAGLLARLADDPARLLVTLEAVSQPERRYGNLVKEAFHSGLIRGELGFGAGLTEADLERLAICSDLIVSSSVQEGFGYLFMQALQWGLPLMARRLDTMGGFLDIFDGYPADFYSALVCSIEPRERKGLQRQYRARLRDLRGVLPAHALGELGRELAKVLEENLIDFSYLDPPLQTRVLKRAASSRTFLGELRDANRSLCRSVSLLLDSRPLSRAHRIEERFGLPAYAKRIERLLASFDEDLPKAASDPYETQRRVRESFARKEYLRLLYC